MRGISRLRPVRGATDGDLDIDASIDGVSAARTEARPVGARGPDHGAVGAAAHGLRGRGRPVGLDDRPAAGRGGDGRRRLRAARPAGARRALLRRHRRRDPPPGQRHHARGGGRAAAPAARTRRDQAGRRAQGRRRAAGAGAGPAPGRHPAVRLPQHRRGRHRAGGPRPAGADHPGPGDDYEQAAQLAGPGRRAVGARSTIRWRRPRLWTGCWTPGRRPDPATASAASSRCSSLLASMSPGTRAWRRRPR